LSVGRRKGGYAEVLSLIYYEERKDNFIFNFDAELNVGFCHWRGCGDKVNKIGWAWKTVM
jgi:hypothetical protein